MPLYTAKKQVASVLEAVAGTAPSGLDTAANADILVIDAAAAYDTDRFTRNFARDSITPLKQIPGQKAATISFTAELKPTSGGTYGDGAPNYGRLLQSCGLKQVGVIGLGVGAVTNGPFRHGEVITGGTSTATGVVVMDTHNGASEIFVEVASITNSPFLDGETITGGSTGATAPLSFSGESLAASLTFATAANDTITRAAGSWLTDGFAAGDDIYIDGGSGSNDGTVYTISSLDATVLTLVAADAVVAEGPETYDVHVVGAGYAWYPKTFPTKTIDLTGNPGTIAEWVEGAVFKGNTSDARGILTIDYTSGDNALTYRPIRGQFTASENAEVIGGTTNDATLASPTGEAYIDIPPISMRLYEDNVATEINGARGNVVFNFETNRPISMAFSFRGLSAAPADIVNISGIDYDYTTPPLWVGSAIGLADNEDDATAGGEGVSPDEADEVTPCLTTLSIDLGNQLADRRCADNSGGLIEVNIGTRQGTGSMDPEATAEADIDWLAKLRSGDIVRLRVPVGTTDPRFTFFMPGVQYNAADGGDRDGIQTRAVSFDLTGGDLFNLGGGSSTLTSTGGDNELVLVYHTGS